MKKIILFLVILISVLSTSAQKWQDGLLYGEGKQGIAAKRILLFPTGCGDPSALNQVDSSKTMAGIYFDSCNHRLWLYDPKIPGWDSLHVPSIDITSIINRLDSLEQDSIHIRVVNPLFAVDDTTFALPEVGPEDSGYATPALYDSILRAKNRVYTTSGDGVDTIHSVDGYGNDSVVALIDVGSDKWIVAPQVVYSGVPYNYDITAGIMRLGTRRIDIEPTHVVLDSSEADPRIDKFYSDSSGHSSVLKGIADPNPVEPQVDPTWQKEIAFLQIPGGVGQTPVIDTNFIYKNNAEGWSVILPTGLTVDSANTIPGSVYEGTKSVNVTNTVNSSNYRFTHSTPFDLSPYTSVTLYIKLKAPLTGNNNIAVRWINGTTVVSTIVNLTLVRNNITTFQPVSVNLTQFGLTTNIVTALQVYSNGTTVSPHPGYYLDYAYFQAGIPVLPPIIPVTSISSFNTAQDTLKYTTADGFTHIFRYKPNSTNSNIGSGYRLAIPSTNNIKTLFPGIDLLIDSTSNSNAITIHADTTTGATKLATQGDITRALASISAAPDLQAVTTEGNTTDQDILISSGTAYKQLIVARTGFTNTAQASLYVSSAGSHNSILEVSDTTGILTKYTVDKIINSANRTLKIPLGSGLDTLALLADIRSGIAGAAPGAYLANFYLKDSALSSDRTVDLNGHELSFVNGATITYTADTHTFNFGTTVLQLSGDNGSMTFQTTSDKVFSIGDDFSGYLLNAGTGGTATYTADTHTFNGFMQMNYLGYSDLTYAASLTPDYHDGPNRILTLTGDADITDITNRYNGAFGNFLVIQSSGGGWNLTVPDATLTINLGDGDSTIVSWIDVNGTLMWATSAPPAAGASALSALTDVTLTSLATNDFLKYNGSAWINRTPANVKTDLSLNSVENTALSTWAGSANITTLGTIGTGTWQGSVISSTYGGTGVNNAGRTLTINTNSGTLAYSASSKTLTIAKTLTLDGTDATTMTFPTTSATIARTDAAQTFTGVQTLSSSPVLSSGAVTVSGNTVTFPTTAVTLASLTGTETLTNKRITPRTTGTTSSATPTINTDNFDVYNLTAQAADITSFTTNLSGTPTDWQRLQINITGTATRAITWGASFESSTVSLPTTTSGTNMLSVIIQWNPATSKWRCAAWW